jgi:hypothetical protein
MGTIQATSDIYINNKKKIVSARRMTPLVDACDPVISHLHFPLIARQTKIVITPNFLSMDSASYKTF